MRYACVFLLGMISLSTAAVAQQVGESTSTPGPAPLGSTATITVIPGAQQDRRAPVKDKITAPDVPIRDYNVRPFSKIGVAVKVGTLGLGFDVATPLSSRFNLRAGATFFAYSPTFTTDGANYAGDLNLNSGQVQVDWFPMRGGFHVSPGVMILSPDLNATLAVPGGSTFTLDDVTYTSQTTNPIHGTGHLDFGHKVAPMVTVGWGNIVPRSGKHWSVPFEIGAAYIGKPTIKLALQGTACQTQGCFNAATDPTIQSNLVQEQNQLNDDLKGIQVYPVITIGVSYKF